MGWLMLALVGLAAAMALWALRLPRLLWSFAGSALMLGGVGYALQGRPTLPGQPARADAQRTEIDPALVELRGEMLGRFGPESAYFFTSDALTRFGESGQAIKVLLGGIEHSPRSAALWTGLGDTLAIHDRTVSPASLFAFRRAMQLDPRSPAPSFFLGLAYVRGGQFAQAALYWRHALALAPKNADYREGIAIRLALLERLLASMPPDVGQ